MRLALGTVAIAVGCALGVVSSTVHASEPDPPRAGAGAGDAGFDPDGEPSGGVRVLGFAASLVPGALLHGSGHFVIGRRDAAYRLLAVQGVGLGLIVTGVLPLILTAANRYVVREAGIVSAMGVGAWVISWQTDIHGTLIPLEDRGTPETTLAHLEVEAGYRYVHNPRFRYAHFAYNALELRTGGLRLRPSAQVALDDGNRRLRLLGAYRFLGPRAEERAAPDGTFLELRGAVTHHAHFAERFATFTPEVMMFGRYDLERLHPQLRGLFGEAGLGVGLQLFDYDGLPLGEDTESLLLARMGGGIYFGGPETPVGEVVSYYDHRHDDYVGGLVEQAIGVPGHIGLSGRAWLHDHVGFNALIEVGAAVMAGGALMFRDERP